MTRKQIKAQAARYAKFVEWSDEDQCFIGRCPEIMAGGVHGGDEARVYAELCQAVEEMLELIHADGHALPEPLDGREEIQRQVCVAPGPGPAPPSGRQSSDRRGKPQ
jgi:predicted RNase H-like HicB family nuclease